MSANRPTGKNVTEFCELSWRFTNQNVGFTWHYVKIIVVLLRNVVLLMRVKVKCKEKKGAFTLTETETDKWQQYLVALLSTCSVNTSVLFYTTHFYRSRSLSV